MRNMKQVKIFSASNHLALENVLNEYLNSQNQCNSVKRISYHFPDKEAGLWSAAVEIELNGTKSVYENHA